MTRDDNSAYDGWARRSYPRQSSPALEFAERDFDTMARGTAFSANGRLFERFEMSASIMVQSGSRTCTRARQRYDQMHPGGSSARTIVQSLGWSIYSQCIASAQTVADDKDYPTDHSAIINAGNTMRQWEERLNAAKLALRQPKQIAHDGTPS